MKALSQKIFVDKLLEWNTFFNERKMPWKGEKNPYLIWLSEVILQQTRVEQGLPYFEAFKKKYPTVKKLANAPEGEVMKLWQGLGYYSRARNLHFTAKFVADELQGKFPTKYSELLKLKGVGAYTAAAIASFAFGESVAVVDGNVIRVLSRYFGMDIPFDTTEGKKAFAEIAQQLIPSNTPAAYNQAIMDFGATVCTPKNPDCANCLLAQNCFAFKHNTVELLPVRSKKLLKIERHFCYLLFSEKQFTYIKQRTANDIWKHLYELPLIESSKPFKKDVLKEIKSLVGSSNFKITNRSEVFKQLLTHQKLHITFVEIELQNNLETPSALGLQKVLKDKLHKYAFPKTIAEYLRTKGL